MEIPLDRMYVQKEEKERLLNRIEVLHGFIRDNEALFAPGKANIVAIHGEMYDLLRSVYPTLGKHDKHVVSERDVLLLPVDDNIKAMLLNEIREGKIVYFPPSFRDVQQLTRDIRAALKKARRRIKNELERIVSEYALAVVAELGLENIQAGHFTIYRKLMDDEVHKDLHVLKNKLGKVYTFEELYREIKKIRGVP